MSKTNKKVDNIEKLLQDLTDRVEETGKLFTNTNTNFKTSLYREKMIVK